MITIYSEAKRNRNINTNKSIDKMYRFSLPNSNTDFSTALDNSLLGKFKRTGVEYMKTLYSDFVFRSICIILDDINILCSTVNINKTIVRECVAPHFILCFNKSSNYSDISISMRKTRVMLGALFTGIQHLDDTPIYIPNAKCVFLSNSFVSDSSVICFELASGKYLIDARRMLPGSQINVNNKYDKCCEVHVL